jgi:hypothetical protein
MTTGRTARLLLLLTVIGSSVEPPLAAFTPPPPDACTPQTLGPAVVDIPSIVVRPRFRLNGKAFPGPAAGRAVFTLWASEPSEWFAGPQLVLGETQLPSSPIRVIPGRYDVYYSWINGANVPRNLFTRVLQGVLLDHDQELTVDVPMIHVAGLKQHNGIPFGYDGVATLGLRGVGWPAHVPLGGAQPAAFKAAIIPGRYAFEYDWQQGVAFPHNRHALLGDLTLDANIKRLVLDVPSVIQSFQFLHNGAPFPAALIERGDLLLRRGDGEEVLLGSSHESSATPRIIPGTYDVYWRHVAGANVPGNRHARLPQSVTSNGGVRVIDVPSVEVSGSFLVNGATPPASEIENARISLETRQRHDSVVLGQTRWGAYQKRVVPGTYDIVYEHLAGAATLPSNPRAILAKGWRVQQDPARTIDIPVGVYRGSFLLNGESFGPSAIESGQIFAVSVKPDTDPVSLGRTQYGGFEHRLLPGQYRAGYAHMAGAGVPQNTFTGFGPKRTVTQGGETEGVLDVLAGPLEVSYRHNGVAIPQDGSQNARVHLARGLDYLQLDDAIEVPHPKAAMEGRFDLYYEFRGGADLPRNAFMRFGCWTLER